MKRAIIAIATAALVVVTGCSSSNASGDKKVTKSPSYASAPSTVEKPSAPASPKLNERGNLVKAVGQEGMLLAPDSDAKYFTFVVNSITPGYKCGNSYAEAPKNGQYLAINITVTGGPAIVAVGGAVYVTPHDFQVVGLDGVVENGIQNGGTYGCVASTEGFPQQGVGQGVTGTGTVVVDTKNAAGYLVFHPGVSGGSVGWEYKF